MQSRIVIMCKTARVYKRRLVGYLYGMRSFVDKSAAQRRHQKKDFSIYQFIPNSSNELMAGFQISIIAGKDAQSCSVTASGQVQHIITDEEMETFKVTNGELMMALYKGNGRMPTVPYLHAPTPPFGNLYEMFNSTQTSTIMSITSAEILGITSEPVILKTQEFDNSSSVEATFNVSISDSVSQTATSTWSTGGTFTIGQSISYNIGFLGSSVGGETSLSYSQSWGIGGSESKTVTIGSNSGMQVTLKPGQKVIAELTASRGVMKVRVRYNARLAGCTVVYYFPKHKGNDYYSFSTPVVMSNGGVNNSIVSTEDIEIGYFSNGKITVLDGVTKKLQETFQVDDSVLFSNREDGGDPFKE